MRILANENFPGDAVTALRQAGHDIAWVRVDAPGSTDVQVLQRADAESRILITFDKDFGEPECVKHFETTLASELVSHSRRYPVRRFPGIFATIFQNASISAAPTKENTPSAPMDISDRLRRISLSLRVLDHCLAGKVAATFKNFGRVTAHRRT